MRSTVTLGFGKTGMEDSERYFRKQFMDTQMCATLLTDIVELCIIQVPHHVEYMIGSFRYQT